MKKIARIVLLVFISVFLLVGIVAGIGVYNPRAYEGVLNKLVYENTGYQYSTSNLSIQFSPTIITIEDFELINPAWAQNPKLLAVHHAEISIDIEHLIDKKLPFWNASVSDAEIQFIENEQGELNWNTSVLANQSKPVLGEEEPLNLKNVLSFSEVDINRVSLRHQKQDVAEDVDISFFNLKRADENSVELSGVGIYQEQQVDIVGSVDIEGDNAPEQILQFAMQAKGLGVDLQTNGTVNLQNIDGTKLSLKANSDNLERLEKFLEITFPAVAPVNVSLEFLSSQGSYELSKIDLKLGENYISGDVLFNPNDSFVRANLSSEKIDLGPFIYAEASQDTEDKTSQKIKNVMNGEAEIDWSWMKALNSEINIEIGEILANQQILKDASAQLKLVDGVVDINSLKARLKLNDKEHPERSLVTDLVEISGTIQPLGKKTQGKDVQLAIIVDDGNAKLELRGDLNVNGLGENDLKIEAEAKNLDALSKYLQIDLSSHLPANARANVKTSEDGLLIPQFIANINESDVSGNINVDWSNNVMKINGAVNSKLFDLTPLVSVSKDVSEKTEANKGQVFSDAVIDWAWLESYDVNIDLNVDKLVADKNTFHKVNASIDLGNGALHLKPLQVFYADGRIKGLLMLKKTGDSAKLVSELDAINLSLAAMGATGDSVLEGGITDVVMELSGEGKSLHQIMSSLNGEIVAEVQKGVIKNDAFEIIGSDIILELLTMLNPFMKEDETTELECAAVKFTAKDGVLTSKNQMAVETTKMKIVGGGIVDMNTEELEIGFSPSAKEGFGVNVSSLVKFVRLGGTLSNPSPEADPVGILKSGAALGAAMSSGGLSLLVEGLLKRVTSSGSACTKALQDANEPEEKSVMTPSSNN